VSTRLLETTLNCFPAGTEDYVSHAVLKNYIQDTAVATGVHELTLYNTEVRKVFKESNFWIVETATLHTGEDGNISVTLASTVSTMRSF
jgi:ACS family pantothenate transporter-like MFS transporter